MRKDLNKSTELDPQGALMIGHIQGNKTESKEQDEHKQCILNILKKLHLLQM